MENYEEKYKQALERARKVYIPIENNILDDIFPELKESEDERTRKEILNVFKQLDEGTTICGRNYDYAKWIAWLEKQGEKKQTWKPSAAQLIVIKDLMEDKNTSKVNKVVLRGMFDEFKQFTNSQSSQFSSGHLLDPDKVIEWPEDKQPSVALIDKFKKDFAL